MSTKQSPALQVLIQRYEGAQSKQRPTRRFQKSHTLDVVDSGHGIYTSTDREEKTLTLKRGHLVELDDFEDKKPGEEPVYTAVQKQSSVVRRDKSQMVFQGNRSSVGSRSSLTKSRTIKNISFSFPPFNAYYGHTVSSCIVTTFLRQKIKNVLIGI